MHYVYRFKGGVNNEKILGVLYAGETNNIERRMKEHFGFSGSNLSPECYAQVTKVEYLTFENAVEAKMFEIYYINVMKPCFNYKDKVAQFPEPHVEYDALFNDWKDYLEGDIQEIIRRQIEQRKTNIAKLVEEFEKTNKRLTDLTEELELSHHKMKKILLALGEEFQNNYVYTCPNTGRKTRYISEEGEKLIKQIFASMI